YAFSGLQTTNSSSTVQINQQTNDQNYTYYFNGQLAFYPYTSYIYSINIFSYKLYSLTFTNLNYTTGYWYLNLTTNTNTLPSFNNLVYNSAQSNIITVANTTYSYNASYNYVYNSSSISISANTNVNLTFNISLANESVIFFVYDTSLNNSLISGNILINAYNVNLSAWTNTSIAYNTPYILLYSIPMQFNIYITIPLLTYNSTQIAGIGSSNQNLSIQFYPYTTYINFTFYNTIQVNLTAYLLNYLNITTVFSTSYTYSNTINTIYLNTTNYPYYNNLSVNPIWIGYNTISNSRLNTYYNYYGIYLISNTYSYVLIPNSYLFDQKIIKGNLNLISNYTLTLYNTYPVLTLNFIYPNGFSDNITLSYNYSYISSGNGISSYQTITTNLTNTTIYIPANVNVNFTINSITFNGSSYFATILNVSTEYGDQYYLSSTNTFGFANATFSFILNIIENTTILLQFTQIFFISISANGFTPYYLNISIFNGYMYFNYSNIISTPYISLTFTQNIYYQFNIKAINQSYIAIPSYLSGYLSSNMNYTIVFVYQPSAPTTQINSTVPAPYNFNWIIPNFTIYGYTSDYIFALSFIAFLIGISAYVSYRAKSQMLGIGIILIGTFLLYIVNLIPLWVFVILGILLIVYYLYSRRGENI
ncbi:MAG: hypothetical protein QXU79_04070, partial [Candidatus Micrarchaeaceae archaeon]